MNKKNSKSLVSEIHIPERVNVDTMGDEQAITAPIRRACHICHGMGGIETPSGDTKDCPNRNCDNGMVIVKVAK